MTAQLDHPMKEHGAVMIQGVETIEVILFTARGPLVCPAELVPLHGQFYLLTAVISRQ